MHLGTLMVLGLVTGCCWWAAAGARADDVTRGITFPADARVVDVTQAPYNADRTGMRDSTAAIQKALSDHPSGNRIIYLPDGTYLITDTLRWPEGSSEGGFQKRTILQGQSAERTILRIPDNTPAFREAAKPRAVMNTGRPPAQRFRNGIRTLTVDTGSGNPGAIGIQYNANNQGAMHDVTIRSGDGQGVAGLDLHIAEQGPALVRNIRVEGFDIGVRNGHIVNSITLEHIDLRNQNRFGLTNDGQIVTVRGLTSRNRVPAVHQKGGGAMLTLIEATLEGQGGAESSAAIINENGFLVVRDIQTTGYAHAISDSTGQAETIPGGTVEQFLSHPAHVLFDGTPAKPLRLPIKETPDVPWDDPATWAGPHQFGGQASKDTDNTAALQAAIDSGATTVYLPNGSWRIDGDVFVRGAVRRIIGCEAKLAGAGTLRVVGGDSDVVRIERLDLIYEKVNVRHESKRTLVFSSVTFGHDEALRSADGAGDLFLEDVCVGTLRIRNQNVWARQLNPEAKQTKIINDGGNLWILGLKTEQNGTAVHTINGGKTEIVGYFCYANSGDVKVPLFIVEDSWLSMNYVEMVIRKQPFRQIVVQKRGDETRKLEIGTPPGRGGGSAVTLFIATP